MPVRPATPYKGVAVHWPGDHITLANRDHSICLATLRNIENYQMDHAGYGAIAYQVVACLHGRLIEGRTVARHDGANGDDSSNALYGSVLGLIGIGETPNDLMLSAIRSAPAYLNTPLKLYTHNDVRPEPTACPGPDLTAWIEAGYPDPEDDLPTAAEIAKAVWDQPINDPTQPGEKARAARLLYLAAGGTDPSALAAALAPHLNGTSKVDIEAALRAVLGSLDS